MQSENIFHLKKQKHTFFYAMVIPSNLTRAISEQQQQKQLLLWHPNFSRRVITLSILRQRNEERRAAS